MKRRTEVAIYIVVAVIVILALFWGPIIALLFPSAAPGRFAGAEFKNKVTSITGTAASSTVTVAGDGQSAHIADTAAHFAAQPTTVINIVIFQNAPPGSPIAQHPFQLTYDDPHYTGGNGLAFFLVHEDPAKNNCPEISFAQTGGTGSGSQTQNPCGFQGSMGTNEQITLSMTFTMNTAFFLNAPVPSSWGFVIHVTGASDVTVFWDITG